MMGSAKWLKILGLALSLPSTIIAMAFLAKTMVDQEILNWGWSITLFVLVVGNTIFLMVYYAYKIKD